MIIDIAICDDNELHLCHAEDLVRRAAEDAAVRIRTFTDPLDLLRSVDSKSYVPSVAVLDIKLDGMNGIDLAGEFNRRLPLCQIIFLTGYASFATDAYTTDHVWFVLKDRADEFLIPAVRRALDNLDRTSQGSNLMIRTGGRTVRIPLAELVYIERVGRKYRIVLSDSILTETQIPSGLNVPELKAWIIRCHQGFWACERHIRALDRNELVMDNGDRLPISRTFRKGVRDRFFDTRRL